MTDVTSRTVAGLNGKQSYIAIGLGVAVVGMAAWMMLGSSGAPSARDLENAWQQYALDRGYRVNVTINGLACTEAGNAPVDRLRGPGYFCEYNMSQMPPMTIHGSGTRQARFVRVDGAWRIHH